MNQNQIAADAAVQAPSPANANDVEKQAEANASDSPQQKQSAFKNMGLLDRFLAI